MSKHVRVGGAWRNITQVFVKVGTTGGPFNNGWRTVQEGFVRVSGAWRSFFSAGTGKPIGENGSVTFSRDSNDSYNYSVITTGTWSGSPTSFRYQWQYLNGTTWTNITGATSSTFNANTSYTNLTDPKLDTIRPIIWASNDSGESDSFIAPAQGLFVHYRKPSVTQFSVTGSTGFISYSYTEASHNIDPDRTVTISYTGASSGSFNTLLTSGTFPTTGSLTGGTYTFSIVVTNSTTNGASLASDAQTVSNVTVGSLTAGSISVSPSSGEASGTNRVTYGDTLTVSVGSGWSSGLTYTYQWSYSRDQGGVGPALLGTSTTQQVPTTYSFGTTWHTVGEWIQVKVTGTNAAGTSVSTSLLSYIVPPTPTFTLTDLQNATFRISSVASNRATYYKGSYSGSGNGTISSTAIGTNTTVNSGSGTFNVSLIAGATDFNSIARESFTAGTGSVTVTSLTAPTITFNNQSATFTQGGTYALSYSTNSTGAVTFTSSDTSVVTVTGSTLNFITPNTTNTPARTATITLNQAAGGGYSAATKTMTFTLNPGVALVPTFSTPSRTLTGWNSSVIDYNNLGDPWIYWTRQTSFSSNPATPSPTTSWNDADGLISVSNMADGQVTTFTLTLTRFGYQTGQGSVSSSKCIAPTNTAIPIISGTIREGQTVTSSTGTWNGASSYQYNWQVQENGVWTDYTDPAYQSSNSFTIPFGALALGIDAIRVFVRAAASCGTVSQGVSSQAMSIAVATPPPTVPPALSPTVPPRVPPTTPPTTTPPTTTPPRTPPTSSPTVPPRTPPTTPPTTTPPRTPPRTPPTTPPRTPPTTPPRTPPTTPPRTPPIAPPGILTPI